MTTSEQRTADTGISFTRSDERINELLKRWQEICDFQSLETLGYWDLQTTMPAGAIEARMYQLATLQGL